MNELREAYAACEALAKSHYENFPVASKLLPATLRPHVAAIYAFARTADDFADEPGYEPDERLRLLADWRRRLQAIGADTIEPPDTCPSPGKDLLPGRIFLALGDTVRRFSLPISLFDDLLDAFMQDVETTRYATWEEVLDYCRRSANPVGRLILRLAGHPNEEIARLSDQVCTAL